MLVFEEAPLLQAIDRIYEAVERPELWPETICLVGELVGGGREFFIADLSAEGPASVPAANARLRAARSHSMPLSKTDLKLLDQYVDEYGELITRFLKIMFLRILWSEHHNTGQWESIGLQIAHRYLPAVEHSEPTSFPSRPALRKMIATLWEDGRIFSAENLHCMRFLLPHLDRALRLQMRFGAFQLHTDMASSALNSLTLGVVFVDSSGHPLWHNTRAQEILNKSHTLRLSPAGLAGRDAAETRRVRALFEQTKSCNGQLLALKREEVARPLLLIALPLGPASENCADKSARTVLFISDPDRSDQPTVEALRRAFDLTHREAQVVIAVADGQGLQAAADMMGVALTTARSQLQQAFAKTGTSHQAELAALVHRTLTPLRSD